MVRELRPGGADESTLITEDGVAVKAEHRPALSGDRRLAFVVAHGFTGSHDSQAIRRAGDVLVRTGGVVAVSMRGHGSSGGVSTLGDLEVHDVEAAVRWVERLGYQHVATVGFSMGGSVVVRHAALFKDVDAVVSVSAPARWYYRGTPSMRTVHRVVESRLGRAVMRWSGRARITGTPWRQPYPMEPREAAIRLAPIPLLVAHGDSDHYFPLDHADQLAAAGDHVELWVEYGFEHAENAISDELTARIAEWVASRVADAREGSR